MKRIATKEEFIFKTLDSAVKDHLATCSRLKIWLTIGVWCRTRELANEVLEIAHNLGCTWSDGQYFTDDNHWRAYEECSCYLLSLGEVHHISQIKEIGYHVISAEEFIELHKNKKI